MKKYWAVKDCDCGCGEKVAKQTMYKMNHNPKHQPMTVKLPEDIQPNIAWAAGLFEGEGCIGTRWSKRDNAPKSPYIVITSTDIETLEKFQAVCGGKIYGPKTPTGPGKLPVFRLQIGSRMKVIETILLLWPYLTQKRRKQILETFNKMEVTII